MKQKQVLELWMLDRSGEKAFVEVGQDDCPFCQFVIQHVGMKHGSVCFVCDGENVRRIETVTVMPFGCLGLECAAVTVEEARTEIGEASN